MANDPGEIRRTFPDYVVYVPRHSGHDTGNEHLLVFDGPDGSLLAVWTQSTRESDPDQHVVFSRSNDEGATWSDPITLAGPSVGPHGRMASWGFPLVSRSGRVYVIYNQHTGRHDTFYHHAGLMAGRYSDDCGRSWSSPQFMHMPRSRYDSPDETIPPEWIVWQQPHRLTHDGRYFVGMTRWVSKHVRNPNPLDSWIGVESVVEFLRFNNIDDDPPISEIEMNSLAYEDEAIRVPLSEDSSVSVAQEPSIVRLPDGRLFCVMRTSTGHPFWTQSCDDGLSWTKPDVLRRRHAAEKLLHPLSPCPIFDLGGPASGSGQYVLFIHNNDGNYGHWKKKDTAHNRRPVYSLIGRFNSESPGQPVEFDAPILFMDQGQVGLGPENRPRYDLSLYASMTVRDRNPILWYPDRKYFLLGKRVSIG